MLGISCHCAPYARRSKREIDKNICDNLVDVPSSPSLLEIQIEQTTLSKPTLFNNLVSLRVTDHRGEEKFRKRKQAYPALRI